MRKGAHEMRRTLAAATLACCASLPALALAQGAESYPARPVRFIVGLAAGGAPDVYARLMAQALTERFGQQFIVENRPGTGSIVAADAVAKSAPDGYTVFVGATNVFTVNPHIYKSMPFDPFRDLSPVALGIATTLWLIVNPTVNARTVKELIAVAKAQPTPMPYASSGIGGIHHLTTEAFMEQAGIELLHVPFKGATQTLPALVAGDVKVAFIGYGPVASAVKAGKLRVIAFAMDRRSRLTPEVPTVAESGLPGFNMSGSTGQFVRAGTSKDIIAKLSGAFLDALKTPEVEARIHAMGLQIIGQGTEDYTKLIKAEQEHMARLIKKIGPTPE